MILTVFCTANDAASQWKAELLESTWRRAEQPGELIRLVAAKEGQQLPRHRFAHVVNTLPWNPHPYTGDEFTGYDLPASLLEWLYRERIDATILLLEPDSVFRKPITDEVAPGTAFGAPWLDHPNDSAGPFGLGADFSYLEQIAANRTLEPARITLPVLIHSRDLLKMTARWLELTMLLRQECAPDDEALEDAHRIAYTIAAAENRITHQVGTLRAHTTGDTDDTSEAPILDYSRPVQTSDGELLWDCQTYEPWQRVQPEEAKAGPGRELLTLLEEKITLDLSGGELAFLVPRRRKGVREARVLDKIMLEIPGQEDNLSLNPSAAAIWELCDDLRSLADIVTELERQFEMEPGQLRTDIEEAAQVLAEAGALEIVRAAR